MPVVVNLIGRIDSGHGLKGLVRALATCAYGHQHAGFDTFGDARDIEGFETGKTMRRRSFPILKLQGKHAHADEVASVDALKTFSKYRADAEQAGPFGSPIPG